MSFIVVSPSLVNRVKAYPASTTASPHDRAIPSNYGERPSNYGERPLLLRQASEQPCPAGAFGIASMAAPLSPAVRGAL